MSIDNTTRDLIADCLARIRNGEDCAAFDLASVFLGHAHEQDIGINLAIVEALATLASMHGCDEAGDFLKTQWADMQTILRRRLARAGFSAG
ncbi:hypothetical protein C7T35_40205 [Variovorax sp. WS11]|uniref:hypothetical protein n=1 Tax=Variovorax sp. WS11 TaxID=1105204 RepID=UPI000D0D00AF|nr:hypothetical protein [Variovorax sp. WS11]NDZ17811.1 hypothetical protein [Variovorax sp. WS11]PSL78950.1 hypothetical protein C7T35_40205 [Variovorax sp. WS11]